MKKRVEKTGRSPYRKYNKSPYKYMSGDCSHSHVAHQSVAMAHGKWEGKVCTRCNIIVKH